MSLFAAMNSATQGLRTVQANVKLVSDNIAQADNKERTRHSLTQTTDATGNVVAAQYMRSTDSALQAQVDELTAQNARYDTQSSYLKEISDAFGTSDDNTKLTDLVSSFAAAWKTLQGAPEDATARAQVVSTARSFTREVNALSTSIDGIASDMRTDMNNSIDHVNDLLSQIDDINGQMSSLMGQGDTANTVLDKRDALVTELNKYVGVRTMERPDGRLAVYTNTGLTLVDASATKLSYDGANITIPNGSGSLDVSSHFSNGSLGAMREMLYDGSQAKPATTASSSPTSEIFRKLRDQLDSYANAFTSATKDGEPTSFADAYNNASPTVSGEQDQAFFIGTDRYTFALNESIVDGTKSVKTAAIGTVLNALNATGRSFSADGLRRTDSTYIGMASSITANVSTIASDVTTQSEYTQTSYDTLSERLSSKNGVNIDTEIALLQQLQTSYSASARVLQVTNTMLDALEAVVK